MCGISGFYVNSSIKKSRNDLEFSIKCLNHRGPDSTNIYFDENNKIGLAHSRLSIIDTSVNGSQPMVDPKTGVCIVFNGELYNYKICREKLVNKGYKFFSQSDTEVLLKLYVYYKGKCKNTKNRIEKILSSINGIFAFCIWDPQAQEMMVCRDELGVKPLYYSENDFGFFFASELKGLRASQADLDYIALQRYFNFLWCPGNRTPFRNIYKLEPGKYIIIKLGKITENVSHYLLPYWNNKNKEKYVKKGDLINQTRELIQTCVKDQLISDVKLGAFLSGGLDSTSVVAFARKYLPEIDCFTISVDGMEKDGFQSDLPFAIRAAKHLGVKLNILEITSEDLISDLDKVVYHLDEPVGDPASLNVFQICKNARKHDTKVLLSGTGGDELFTGYPRHLAAKLHPIVGLFPISIGKFLSRYTSKFLNSNHHRRFDRFVRLNSETGNQRLINHYKILINPIFKNSEIPLFSNPINNKIIDRPLNSFLEKIPYGVNDIEKLLGLDKRFFMADHNLNYTDKMSMASGVEVRVPLLDKRLIEFASKIPTSYKLKRFETKHIFKRAMEGILPNKLIYRKKTGFGLPLRSWLKKELREYTNDILHSSDFNLSGIFNTKNVKRLVKENEQGKCDAAFLIFSIILFEKWYKINVLKHQKSWPKDSC